mgnify:CR=1 FL=1
MTSLRSVVKITLMKKLSTYLFLILFSFSAPSFADDIQEYGYLRTFGNLFYFSVVVFSTVGFGEITPLGLLNKTVMIFEGLTGGIITTIFIIAIYRKLLDR